MSYSIQRIRADYDLAQPRRAVAKPQLRQWGDDYSCWQHYEMLKRELCGSATTPAEYEAACRRAAEIAGV